MKKAGATQSVTKRRPLKAEAMFGGSGHRFLF